MITMLILLVLAAKLRWKYIENIHKRMRFAQHFMHVLWLPIGLALYIAAPYLLARYARTIWGLLTVMAVCVLLAASATNDLSHALNAQPKGWDKNAISNIAPHVISLVGSFIGLVGGYIRYTSLRLALEQKREASLFSADNDRH